MRIRKPWLIKLMGLLGFWLIRCWMSTISYRIITQDDDEHPLDARRKRVIYVFWHESILFPTLFRIKVRVLISHHADGELIARVCGHLGYQTVRGSSRRGGTEALMDLVRPGKVPNHLFVTPDGPRGPRRRVQLGLIFLASRAGLPIIPCGVGYRRARRFGSWDRFALPRPWTSAVCVTGAAIHVPPRLSRRELECCRDLVEARMREATAAAERLAGAEPAAAAHEADTSSCAGTRIAEPAA